jgi:Predicted membrane protein
MWSIIGQSILLACVGTLLLRIAGRKSISQMTMPQVLIMLTLGTVLGSEVSGKGIAYTILALATFIGFLIVIEWITLHSNIAEKWIKGMAVSVIEHGKPNEANLRKLRISIDDLEKKLRIAGISRISDVKSGTIEVNGDLGYELYSHAQPVTKGDLEQLLRTYFPQTPVTPSNNDTIFSEVQTKTHDHKIPDRLQ